jgi:hypothetical protein
MATNPGSHPNATDKNGSPIKVGDQVTGPDGATFTVGGIAPVSGSPTKAFLSNQVTASAAGQSAGQPKPTGGGAAPSSTTVIWGS